MNDLVINHNGTPATTQDKVSVLTANDQQSIQRLIRTYKTDLEEFGTLEFENTRIQAGAGYTTKKLYYLNEQQATLLLTYMKNTKQVRTAKKLLVKAFYEIKQELQSLKFSHYVSKIADLDAQMILTAKHNTNVVNGYKSQLKQHNAVIVSLRKELKRYEGVAEAQIMDDSFNGQSARYWWGKYIGALGNNNALKIQNRCLIEQSKKYEAKENKTIISLSRIQKDAEAMFLKIGAVMAYIDNDKNEDLLIERCEK